MKSAARIRRWLGHGLLVGGILLLTYATASVLQREAFQRRSKEWLALEAPRIVLPPRSQPSARPAAPAPDGILGRLDIPGVGISVIIVEGTGGRALGLGAGHICGTPLPGETGNVAIAGHRDTFFRPLRHITNNERIILTTLAGSYQYYVASTEIVAPDDVRVLAPSQQPELTLVTCYPFYYVGGAPKRFVVHARAAAS